MLDKQLSFNDDRWVDRELRRKLEIVNILEAHLYQHNALSLEDYKEMLKYADHLDEAAENVVRYLERKVEEYTE